MVSAGTSASLPALSKTYGRTLMTLEPSIDLTHTATPTVITHNEMSNSRCCQQKAIIFLFIRYYEKLRNCCIECIWKI